MKLKYLLQGVFFAASVAYLASSIEFGPFLDAFKALDPLKVMAVTLLCVIFVSPAAFRLMSLSEGRIPVSLALSATYLCLGANSVLPGRMGEVVKPAFLATHSTVRFREGLGFVYLERLADLNAVLLLYVLSDMPFSSTWVRLALTAGVLLGWAAVVFCRIFPWLPPKVVGVFGLDWLTKTVEIITETLACSLQWRKVLPFSFWTMMTWAGHLTFATLCMNWVGGLGLDFNGCIFITAALALGMALPSTPAAVGVLEAAAVVALMLLGVEEERALAAALVLHFAQVLPFVLFTFWLMATGRLLPSTIRFWRAKGGVASEEEPLSCGEGAGTVSGQADGLNQ